MKSAAVDVKTASQVRANLKAVLDTVTEQRTPVIISRRKREPVVMVPLSEWNRWQERDGAVSAGLDESIAQAERGELFMAERTADGYVLVERAAAAE